MQGTELSRRLFLDEAQELCIELEEALLELEQRPGDTALLARTFRVLHTLKGSSAMFGYASMARVAHSLESVFDRVRAGNCAISAQLLGTALDAKDMLVSMLASGPDADSQSDEAAVGIEAVLAELVRDGEATVGSCHLPEPNAPGAALRPSSVMQPAAWAAGYKPVAGVVPTPPSAGMTWEQGEAGYPAQHAGTPPAWTGGRDAPHAVPVPEVGMHVLPATSEGAGGAGSVPVPMATLASLEYEGAIPELSAMAAFSSATAPASLAAQAGPAEAPTGAASALHQPHGTDLSHRTRPALSRLWVRYRPGPESLQVGIDPVRILDALASHGAHTIWPVLDGVPALEALDPATASTGWELFVDTSRSAAEITTEYRWMLDDGALTVHDLGPAGLALPMALLRHVASLGVAPDAATLLTVATGMQEQAQEVPGEAPFLADVAAPLGPPPGSARTLRVDSAKLDNLMALAGEFVILQARLSRLAGHTDDEDLREVAEGIERLSVVLRDQAMALRMVPMTSMFGNLRRLVRDLTAKLGKKARLETIGGATELDKNLIDHLRDPLVHLLRNAMDHGLESPEGRRAAGKPAEGVIRLEARHSGGEVIITVSDDGGGIDMEKVRARAVNLGLLAPDEEISPTQLVDLLFQSGFSTAANVSDVSGRGVGMDVVREAINELRGSVDIESTPGQGTTVRIRMPLTLAIIDGLRVRVGAESYVLPLMMVEACLERFVDDDVRNIGLVEYRGERIPCISLRRLLGVPGVQPGYERIIVASTDAATVGLAVDSVVGLQQAVIKGVSDLYREVAWISGTTVDAEGGISLILDVPQLVRYALERETPRRLTRS